MQGADQVNVMCWKMKWGDPREVQEWQGPEPPGSLKCLSLILSSSHDSHDKGYKLGKEPEEAYDLGQASPPAEEQVTGSH